jgi:hypothetical protein
MTIPSSAASVNYPSIISVEENNDPVANAQFRARAQQAARNSAWLQAHWSELLPQAFGKFVAVAGQQAFLAETATEAWSKARAAHPEDEGVICQYVLTHRGPRIYANRW